MNPREVDGLLDSAVPRHPGTWADFGAGAGTFTRALARRLGPGSRIYAVDRDPNAVEALRLWAGNGDNVIPVAADFTRPFALPKASPGTLDGMVMANALHFVPDPEAVLARLVRWLRPGGRVVVVEYDGRRANRWVPHPIPAARLPEIATNVGLSTPTITASRPSVYGGTLYVAVAKLLATGL